MEGVPRRERKWLVSGAARQGLLWPAGHREPLFLGSELPGPEPEQDLAWLPLRAHGPCRQRPASHWQEKIGKKKKLANGTSLPFRPSVSHRASNPLSA